MAQIKYLDSRRIMGASGDTVEESTFEDDFSSDNWTDYGSDFGVSGGTMAWNKTANSGSWINLGSSLSDEKWVCRFTLNILNASSFNNEQPIFMIGSVSGSVTDATTMDYIGFQLQTYSNDYYIWCGNGATLASPTFNTNLSKTITTGTVYVELRRTSATEVILSIYSDSGFSSLSATKTLTISSGITGLQYFRLHSRLAGTGTINGTIDNLEIYNGLSSVTGKPKQALSLSGCKAYYNFEQTSGNLINQATTANGFTDGLGSSADGTNNGATTGSTGKVGSYAWSFDGSNDYVDLGTPILGASGTTTATFSFWNNLSSTGFIYTDGNYDSTSTWATTIEQLTNGNVRLFIASSGADGGGNHVDSNVSVSAGWNHWVLTYDGSGSTNTDKIKIYLNGVEVSTTSTGTIASSIKTVTPNARIGALYTGAGNYFGGLIDELAIFNRVLTSSEISLLYNSGTGIAVNDSSLKAKIETNSIFVETDTASRWWFDGTYWNMQPTYQTDFSSSTGWTTVGSNITITGGVIQASSMVTQSNNRIYYDLGLELSDKFVVDFDHYANTASVGGFWQMFALTDTTSIPRTDDSIHVLIDMGNWISYLRYSNEGSETNVGSLGNLTTGQWQYVRFVRNGTTGTLTVYSDSDRTTQVLNVSGTIPATVTGLRYFQSGALSGANAGTTTYKIDNLKIYNGVTSVQQ